MTQPKRHHFVPQFLLRNFADADDKLWVLRKETGKLFQGRSDAIFAENHLYSTIDDSGAYDAALEKEYSKLESAAAPIVTDIVSKVRDGVLPTLNQDQRSIWSQFYYQQIKRVPEFHAKLDLTKDVEGTLEGAIAKYEALTGKTVTEAEIAELKTKESLAKVQRNALARALADAGPRVMTLLMQIGLQFGRAEAPIVIGSQPIARVTEGKSLHLLDPSVEAWLPLAADIAVRPLASTKTDALVTLPADRVANLNQRVFDQSSAAASATQTPLVALKSPPPST